MPLRHPKTPAGWRQTERGIALAVTLVMLLVILVLGLGALRMSITEERMTGYVFDRQLGVSGISQGYGLGGGALNKGICKAGYWRRQRQSWHGTHGKADRNGDDRIAGIIADQGHASGGGLSCS